MTQLDRFINRLFVIQEALNNSDIACRKVSATDIVNSPPFYNLEKEKHKYNRTMRGNGSNGPAVTHDLEPGVGAWLMSNPSYVTTLMLKEAENTLMRGFTSVRDTAGDVFGVRRVIETGLYPGPRIQGSGMAMEITARHVDFRLLTEKPRQLGGLALSGWSKRGWKRKY